MKVRIFNTDFCFCFFIHFLAIDKQGVVDVASYVAGMQKEEMTNVRDEEFLD